MEPMKNIPVYRHSAAYAVEHGELEAYKTSRVAGVACRDAIEKAVAKHYRDNCLNKVGAREVIDEYFTGTTSRVGGVGLDQLAEDALADACFPGNPRDADHAAVVELFRKVMA